MRERTGYLRVDQARDDQLGLPCPVRVPISVVRLRSAEQVAEYHPETVARRCQSRRARSIVLGVIATLFLNQSLRRNVRVVSPGARSREIPKFINRGRPVSSITMFCGVRSLSMIPRAAKYWTARAGAATRLAASRGPGRRCSAYSVKGRLYMRCTTTNGRRSCKSASTMRTRLGWQH